jgi:glycosyltransferase involved in cell wall biosynthesis
MNKTFVSVLVATKNRPHFFKNILRNFYRQDYPHEYMELIIGDDGECKMEHIIPNYNNIKYIKFDKITLGEKRNKLCEMAKGDIIVFMDDDDFYPKEKVSESVNILNESDINICGSSIMYVYYTKFNVIYKFGPYGKYHSTCGTLAFKKKYIENNKFPNVNRAEEKLFLGNFKNQLIQMNPLKSILVIAHDSNTVDKYKFIKYGKKTNLTLDNFNLTDADKFFYLKLGQKSV